MKFKILIEKYSRNLLNLDEALRYIIDDLYNLSHNGQSFCSKDVEIYNLLINAILVEIKHVNREIVYIQDLFKKEFNHE